MRLYLLLFSLIMLSETSAFTLNYKIEITDPNSHYANVQMEFTQYEQGSISLKMPVWTPGSYMVREFEKNIDRVSASADNNPIQISKTDKNTWHCVIPKGSKTIRISYPVYCFEQSVRTSYIDDDHAFLLLTSCLMHVAYNKMGYNGNLELKYPGKWTQVSTTLKSVSKNVYSYNSYDELVDSPIEIGTHEEISFDVAGVTHKAALVGRNNCDKTKFTADLQKVCQTMYNIIGEHPCESYLFIIHHVDEGGGGLEHANSCVVQMPRFNYSNTDRYKAFLGLCAHEYFHLWNVKRIRPFELGPFNYSKENHTNLLWVAEGITSYYDELGMYRAGFTSQPDYLRSLASGFGATLNRQGGKVQSMHEASFDAWIKEYRSTENSINNNISYYLKGQTLAALLDIEILSATGGKKRLDHLMQHLYNTFYKKLGRGFTDDEFYAAIDEVAGKPLNFRAWAEGLNDENTFTKIAEIVKKAGCSLSDRNKGLINYSGFTTEIKDSKQLIRNIEFGSPAMTAGLQVGDEIIAINGVRVKGNIDDMYKQITGPYTFLISRGGLIRSVELTLAKNPKYDLLLSIDNSEDPIMKEWLKTNQG